MKIKIFIATLFFLASFVLEAKADAVYLKNGRRMDGKIKKRNEEGIWLDIMAGSVKFNWEQIESVQILNPDGTTQEIKQRDAIEPAKGVKSGLLSDKESALEKLTETEAFYVSYPSNWEEELKAGRLVLKGPLLDSALRPSILIIEERDEAAIRSMEKTKEVYYRWKDLPAIKEKMMEFITPVFYTIYGADKYKFISCDYEEKGDFIIQRLVSIEKAHNVKMCDTSFITKTEPTRSYSLIFYCPQEHYDEYLSVFEKCLDSFSLKK